MTFMAACNEDFNEDVAAPQGWDQVSAIKVAGFTAKAADVVNLGEAKGDSVAALNVTLPNSLPYGVTLANLKLVLTPEGSSNTYTINAGPTGKVAVADLQEVINTEYGLRPDTRTFSAELTADYMDGGLTLITRRSLYCFLYFSTMHRPVEDIYFNSAQSKTSVSGLSAKAVISASMSLSMAAALAVSILPQRQIIFSIRFYFFMLHVAIGKLK